MDSHKTWIKPSDSTVASFEQLTMFEPDIQRKKMFGSPAAFINGRMFAWIHQDKIALRLPQEARTQLLQEGTGEPVDPTGKRMREYCMLMNEITEDETLAQDWVRIAFEYVASLPPK